MVSTPVLLLSEAELAFHWTQLMNPRGLRIQPPIQTLEILCLPLLGWRGRLLKDDLLCTFANLVCKWHPDWTSGRWSSILNNLHGAANTDFLKMAWRGLWSDSTVIFSHRDMYWLNLWQAKTIARHSFSFGVYLLLVGESVMMQRLPVDRSEEGLCPILFRLWPTPTYLYTWQWPTLKPLATLVTVHD